MTKYIRRAKYPLTVHYGWTHKKWMRLWKYDWCHLTHDDYNIGQFPLTGSGTAEVDARLFHFDHDVSSGFVLDLLDKTGYRAATFAELLAFGAAFPNVLNRYNVVALGSVGDFAAGPKVTYIEWDYGEAPRMIALHRFDLNWDSQGRWHFLAVRK